MKIYVASSWRNESQQDVVKRLRDAGHEVYDFKNPEEGDHGFHWSQIDEDWESWTPEQFRENLSHPIAKSGFKKDFDAVEWSDACVYVLPCGRSASLEAGWIGGSKKPLFILLADGEPELMFKFAEKTPGGKICLSIEEVVQSLSGNNFKFNVGDVCRVKYPSGKVADMIQRIRTQTLDLVEIIGRQITKSGPVYNLKPHEGELRLGCTRSLFEKFLEPYENKGSKTR